MTSTTSTHTTVAAAGRASSTASRPPEWTRTYTAGLLQRIFSRCVRVGDCLVWTGYRNWGGYGYCGDARTGQRRRVHRIAYEIARGPIPDGLVIDHLCGNRACGAVNHLEAVTQAENLRRARTARRYREK